MSDDLSITTSPVELATEESTTLTRVLGLVGFTFLFTAGGAVLGAAIGPGAIWLGLGSGFITLLTLLALREETPVNLGLLYAFGLCEGLAFGPLLNLYLLRGMGDVVLLVGLTTAIVSVGAGIYGATTRRDLTDLGDILLVGLIGIVGLVPLALLLQAPLVSALVSALAAALFTAYVVYDVNQAVRAGRATQGKEVLIAVNLYLDMLNLFLQLLCAAGDGD